VLFANSITTLAGMAEISLSELRRHNQPSDFWMALNLVVLSMTGRNFVEKGRLWGGSLILKQLAGQNVTFSIPKSILTTTTRSCCESLIE
jgi:hypothetical protein